MKLILARHGNTFGPGDKVVWVGASNDLPLVEHGLAQAERVGAVLKNIPLAAAYYAPLARTKKFAEIAVEQSGSNAPLHEDKRLTELDYGMWSGLSDAEITEKFGEQCLKDWMHKSAWPAHCDWSSDEQTVRREVQDFVADITKKHDADANVLIVSSNGRLRYFLPLIAGEFDKRVADGSFKVATGRVCLIEANGKDFALKLWNDEPERLTACL